MRLRISEAHRRVAFFLLMFGAVMSSSCGLLPEREPAEVRKLRDAVRGQNLVMILLDAAAFGHFGFAGYDRDTTPTVDALAAESLVFKTAYAPAASTGHTVYTMLTSTYPFLGEAQGLRGIVDASFRVTESTHLMAELLAPRFPHRSGISANEWFGVEFGFDRGFTDFYETYINTADSDTTETRAERMVDMFRADLELWGDEPAFSYLHFLEPHAPYTPPERFARMFDPVAADSVDAGARALMRYRFDKPKRQRQEMIRALYDANLAYADSLVSEVISALKEHGKWDDTVVLVIADHGEAFWQHEVYGHGRHIYEEFMRIPFVLRVPGMPELAGREIHEVVSLVDLLPTYLDLFELPPSPDQRGDSLLPLIAGRSENFKNRLVYLRNTHGDAPEFGLRSGPYKWLYRVFDDHYELYNLVNDPRERRDLVAAKAIPREAAPLMEQIALWMAIGTEQIEPVTEIDPETRERLRAIGYF